MNYPKPYIPREPATLKDAQTELVRECGGTEKAAALTRVSPSSMQRYTAPSDNECNMPVDVVLALEMHCGVPHVTRFLALQTQHVLVSVAEGSSADTAVHMALIGQHTGELYKQFGESIADGTISNREAARLSAAAMRDINALAALCGDLGRIHRGETA